MNQNTFDLAAREFQSARVATDFENALRLSSTIGIALGATFATVRLEA
jgi:hypothetical protein